MTQSKHLPTAINNRPTFGSAPWIMVFTSGEFTIDFATLRASWSEAAVRTVTRRRCSAPSPSRASISAMRVQPAVIVFASSRASTAPASTFVNIGQLLAGVGLGAYDIIVHGFRAETV